MSFNQTFEYNRKDIQETFQSVFDYISSGRKAHIKAKLDLLSLDEYIFSQFLVDFALWNQPFNGAVTALAAKWALEGDEALSIPYFDGRSLFARINMELISSVEDEIGLGKFSTTPHQELAQGFAVSVVLNTSACIGHYSSQGHLQKAKKATHNGYSRLFIGLGYHMASELNASGEFEMVHNLLKEKNPDLYTILSETEWPDSPRNKPIIEWLSDHVGVEIEHFNHAVNAAAYALMASSNRKETLGYLRKGIKLFHADQDAFFDFYTFQ